MNNSDNIPVEGDCNTLNASPAVGVPTHPKDNSGYDTKLHLMVMLQFWGMKYLFIAITPMSTLTRSGSTCQGPINECNRSIQKLFVFNGNT